MVGDIMILNIFFSKKNKMRLSLLVLTAFALWTAGCSGEETGGVSVSGDGKITASIVESFDKAYYNQDELQNMILEEAASYNRSSGESLISVDKVSVENGVAKVRMTYADADAYAGFNNGVFFMGTVSEAQMAGYDTNKVLTSVNDSLTTVGQSDMLAMTGVKILITDMKEPVLLPGKAVYISQNAAVDKKLKTVTFDEESEGLAYILYKE
jgi:hypothetical protein